MTMMPGGYGEEERLSQQSEAGVPPLGPRGRARARDRMERAREDRELEHLEPEDNEARAPGQVCGALRGGHHRRPRMRGCEQTAAGYTRCAPWTSASLPAGGHARRQAAGDIGLRDAPGRGPPTQDRQVAPDGLAGQNLRPPKARTWARRGPTPAIRVSGKGFGGVSVAGLVCLRPGAGPPVYRVRIHRGRRASAARCPKPITLA